MPELRAVRVTQRRVAEKLSRPQPYVDSDVRLRTELIGPGDATARRRRDDLGAGARGYDRLCVVARHRLERLEDQRRIRALVRRRQSAGAAHPGRHPRAAAGVRWLGEALGPPTECFRLPVAVADLDSGSSAAPRCMSAA